VDEKVDKNMRQGTLTEKERLYTVHLLIKTGCFVKKKNIVSV
jgi:hypothetical protein